ncbi:ABC transporter substrate-binding protein [Lacisediminihabitans profunda]|uniref:ABC transporter substrate-binding protein n=1 Tax=Lacisediminihabitans profunda TaxID=2594790 RepID=A0A5C8UQB5_9MICO|nr:ABC transporter substrate-binding protein [Lacisediminihabitans profunda]TXN30647.1 ABC transporter substrate-binding protein [Lacisediminihabitans profunda]
MKNLTRAGIIAIAATLLITGCSSTTGAAGTAVTNKGGTLTILTPSTKIDLDPAKSQNLAITTLGLIERRLTTWDIRAGRPATVVPDLATTTGTPSDGGKTWTFTLKDGLKFADGSAITSADIKYGVERSFSDELSGGLSYHKSLLVGGADYHGPYSGSALASIETPSPKSIVFHLTGAYGDWPWIASMPAFSPVPQAKDNPATYGQDPVASGPYKVASNKQGTALTLTRNTYWSAKSDTVRVAGPDSVVFRMSQDPSTAAQSLISDAGDTKAAFGAAFLGAAQLAQVNRDPAAKARLATSQAGPLSYLALNTQRGALKNLDVRKALEYAVDKKAYLIASGGAAAGETATTLITPGIAGRQAYDLYPAGADGDVKKAKSLLAKAGQSSGLSLTLLVLNDATSLAKAQAIQQGVQRAGITVTIAPEDENSFYSDATATDANYDLALYSWQPDFPSANSNIQPLFASSEIGDGRNNVARYSNPEVDALIAMATAEVDQKAAQALWAKADKRIMQDAPVVPLSYAKQSFLRGSKVKNFFVASFPAYPNYLTLSLAK